jgi:hypothetical protein
MQRFYLSHFIIFMIMVKDNSILIKSLTKIYDSLYVKGRTDFTIELSKHKFDMEGNTIVVKIYFIIDQSKYWSESPDFNQEYYNFVINDLDEDPEEELDNLAQYVVHDRLIFNHKYYKHSNRGVYKPLLKEIKNMGYDSNIEWYERLPYPTVKVYTDMSDRGFIEFTRELNQKFDTDDILISKK